MILSNSIVTAFGLMAVLSHCTLSQCTERHSGYELSPSSHCFGYGRRHTAIHHRHHWMSSFSAAIFVYLYFTSFGTRQSYDYILNLMLETTHLSELPELSPALLATSYSNGPRRPVATVPWQAGLIYRIAC
jgi:hypothetical protein